MLPAWMWRRNWILPCTVMVATGRATPADGFGWKMCVRIFPEASSRLREKNVDTGGGCDISGIPINKYRMPEPLSLAFLSMQYFKMNRIALCLTVSERTALLYLAVRGLRRFRYFGGVHYVPSCSFYSVLAVSFPFL